MLQTGTQTELSSGHRSDMTPSKPCSALFDLANQTALCTGGTRGIGAASAIALAEAGADVILVQRSRPAPSDDDPALETYNTIKRLGRQCEIVECDLGSGAEAIKRCWADALRVACQEWRKPGIEILVNCAGIQRRNPCLDFTEADWDEVLQVNLKSVFLLCQLAGQHMVPRRYGKIINYASLLTFQGGLTVPAYAAAKAGLAGITKAFSNEWSQHNVCVNAIAPGYVTTDMNVALLKNAERTRGISERIPAGRWGEPADFKGPTVFLASPASAYVNGETLVVDGGWMGR